MIVALGRDNRPVGTAVIPPNPGDKTVTLVFIDGQENLNQIHITVPIEGAKEFARYLLGNLGVAGIEVASSIPEGIKLGP